MNQKKPFHKESLTQDTAVPSIETKIGEILSAIPKKTGQRTDLQPSNTAGTRLETKEQAIKELGFNKMQVSRFEALAANPDLVEQIKQEARESDAQTLCNSVKSVS